MMKNKEKFMNILTTSKYICYKTNVIQNDICQREIKMKIIDRKTKIKIARYYYIENYTQTQIARKLSIPRQTINRVVQNLAKEGIIRFEIIGEKEYFTELESELEKKYGLKQVIIIDYDGSEDMVNRLGEKGAQYLQNIIKSNMRLGLSWGKTLGALASRLPQKNLKEVLVVQLVGGSNNIDNLVKADEITRIVAEKLNGKSMLLYAPSHVNSKRTKEMLLEESNIKSVFNEMKQCDIAVIGIGHMRKDATLFKEKYLSEKEYYELIQANCVGDICSRYFNREGQIVSHRINERVLGIDINHLKRIPIVVGIAGGEYKCDAIEGALKGGFLNVLITTKNVAEKLVDEGEEKSGG